MLSGIGRSLGSIGTIAGGILTSQVFTAIARQIGAMVTSAIDATAQMQNMRMMLTNLQARELMKTGDFVDMNAALAAAAPLAKATMDQLERIATLSPYQLENVSNTYRMAMAFGYTSGEATVFTKALLTMGAGVGASGEMLDRMAYNLAQVRLQGKVTAVDIRQLAMAGLDLNDVLKYVGKQMGVNIETHEDFNKAIADGSITWEDFTTNFAKYADQNFGGAAERMSRTLEGLKSTFKDVFLLTMPKILGPAAELVTGLLNDILTSFLNFNDSGALQDMGQNFADWLTPGINSIRSILLEMGLLKSAFEDERGWEPTKKFDLGEWLIDGTESFKKWAEDIDWTQVSASISSGIDKIDWSGIGASINVGAGNIFSGLSTLATFDFTEIANSASSAFADAVLGAFGSNMNWDELMMVWENNFDQFKIIASNKGIQLGAAMMTIYGAAGTNAVTSMAVALGTGAGAIVTTVLGWIPKISVPLEMIKKLFFNMFQAAAQQAVRALLGMQDFLVSTVKNFIAAVQKVIRPINLAINVSIPNFAALAQQIMDGMAMLNAARNGSGYKGGKSTAPGGGNSPGTTGSGSGSRLAFAGGGVASGPKSGYPATLHGTEAVIPLEKGDVPIKLNGALTPNNGGGGFTLVLNFAYAPAFSPASQLEAQTTIVPVIVEAVRNEFAKRGL